MLQSILCVTFWKIVCKQNLREIRKKAEQIFAKIIIAKKQVQMNWNKNAILLENTSVSDVEQV